MGVYHESDLALYVLLYHLCFIIICLDNIDVTVSIRASILQTIGPPSALGTLLPREMGVARGEAPREAPVPVPSESVCDGSRVPSRGPLVCRMVASFCLTSLLSTLLIF